MIKLNILYYPEVIKIFDKKSKHIIVKNHQTNQVDIYPLV
jgi:hypothetical protein